MNKEEKQEQAWLEKTQKQLSKYISSPYWDDIKLSEIQISIITQIMNTKSVNKLSPLINERITDAIIENIKTKINNLKTHQKCK